MQQRPCDELDGVGIPQVPKKSRSSRSLRWEFALWDLSFVVSGPSVPI